MREGFPNMLPPTTPETPWCLPCPLHTHHGQVRVTVIGGRGAGPAGSAHPAGRTARGPARSFGEHLTSVAWGPPAPRPVLDKEATRQPMDPADELLTPAQVAQLFGVDPKTVTRWADTGRLGFIRTPGGHRRFRRSEVTALLADRSHQAR